MPPLEDLLLPSLSCPIEINKGVRGGIRLRLIKDVLEVEIRNANGDVSYNSDKICSRENVFQGQPYYPYIGLVATNTDKIVNDIDISAIYVKNLDDTKYTDENDLEEERLKYLLKKHQGGVPTGEKEDEQVHAHDLLAVKLQDDIIRDHKKNLYLLDPKQDDRFEVLFKYFETIKNQE